MNKNLKTTLLTCLVTTTAAMLLCFITQELGALWGLKLDSQDSLETVRSTIGLLFNQIANGSQIFSNILALLIFILQIVAIMPAVEEVIFRGVLWRWPKPANIILPAITSSILFSAAHYITAPWPNNAFIALFFFGLAQCWLYKKTGSILWPIVNHALFNLINLILLFVIPL